MFATACIVQRATENVYSRILDAMHEHRQPAVSPVRQNGSSGSTTQGVRGPAGGMTTKNSFARSFSDQRLLRSSVVVLPPTTTYEYEYDVRTRVSAASVGSVDCRLPAQMRLLLRVPVRTVYRGIQGFFVVYGTGRLPLPMHRSTSPFPLPLSFVLLDVL